MVGVRPTGQMNKRRIEVVDYDPAWPKLFETEQTLLCRVLGEVAERIRHIGSTAVPGLAAKPIIDILVEVTDLESLDAMNNEMSAIGYTPMGEFGIPGSRYCDGKDAYIKRHVEIAVKQMAPDRTPDGTG